MGRGLKLNKKKIAEIQALRRRGLSYAAISREAKVSVGSVGNALKHRAVISDPKPPPTDAHGAPTFESNEQAVDDHVTILRRTMRELDQKLGDAHRRGDMSAYATLVTRLNQTSASLAKFAPRTSDDPNEQPDMIAAAAQGRAKLHAILDRVYAERDAAREREAEEKAALAVLEAEGPQKPVDAETKL